MFVKAVVSVTLAVLTGALAVGLAFVCAKWPWHALTGLAIICLSLFALGIYRLLDEDS